MTKVEMVRMESRWKDEQRVKSGLLISTLPHLPQPPRPPPDSPSTQENVSTTGNIDPTAVNINNLALNSASSSHPTAGPASLTTVAGPDPDSAPHATGVTVTQPAQDTPPVSIDGICGHEPGEISSNEWLGNSTSNSSSPMSASIPPTISSLPPTGSVDLPLIAPKPRRVATSDLADEINRPENGELAGNQTKMFDLREDGQQPSRSGKTAKTRVDDQGLGRVQRYVLFRQLSSSNDRLLIR